MLTDTKLKNIAKTGTAFKLADRDGLYVHVSPVGGISFRYNYRLNDRQETVVLGRYGSGGMTLRGAREALVEARKAVLAGISPARSKGNHLRKRKAQESFAVWAERWLDKHKMSESTRAMRRWTYERDLKGQFGSLLLSEIDDQLLRSRCDAIVGRDAPSVAVHAREIVMLVFRYAEARGEKHVNPADAVPPSSIATFAPRERNLSPEEIRIFYKYLERTKCSPVMRLACKMLLLTMVRKSELTDAEWDEVDFAHATWTIPKGRMKRKNPHNVYLPVQAMDMLVALKTCSAGSRYILPSRYDPDRPMNGASLNGTLGAVVAAAREGGATLDEFCPHDLRRTASTLLHEAGYNADWIEKCLAHEQRGVRAVYNKAEYAEQRRGMMQDWANMIDRWTLKS